MLENLPLYVTVIFGLTTLVSLFLFYYAIKNSTHLPSRKKANSIFLGMLAWLMVQAVLSFMAIYYNDTHTLPPKLFLFGILPTFIAIILLFITRTGKRFIDGLPLYNLTWLHVVRIPVELVLWWLFLNKKIPGLMTFEGRNFDILAGISAPFIAYFGFIRKSLSKKLLLLWNFACLALLFNIVVNALLSSPFPFQRFAFDQPNIAVLYFPFSWLPVFIVPLVLLAHLISIRRLLNDKTK